MSGQPSAGQRVRSARASGIAERVLDARGSRRARPARTRSRPRAGDPGRGEHQRASRQRARRQPAVGEQQQHAMPSGPKPDTQAEVLQPAARRRRRGERRAREVRAHVPAYWTQLADSAEEQRPRSRRSSRSRCRARRDAEQRADASRRRATISTNVELAEAVERRSRRRGRRVPVGDAQQRRVAATRDGDAAASQRALHGSLLSHSETCAGCTVSRTTRRRSRRAARRGRARRAAARRTPPASAPAS